MRLLRELDKNMYVLELERDYAQRSFRLITFFGGAAAAVGGCGKVGKEIEEGFKFY